MKRKVPKKAELREKTARVARKLEKFLGVPVPSKRKAPALDMLIATLLSQNTNDRNSHRAYVQLRKRFAKWQDVLNAPV
ncbi:MAG TPA: endonuclease III, partial [Bacteroidota bacterium]